jgi:dTMP kinase
MNVSVARGRLIVLEGGDGVGKTTQLPLVADALRATGLRVQTIREPGQTQLGQRVRELLLDPDAVISPATEALLFLAARAQAVSEIVLPALTRGEWVVADRFFVSTYAYQIAGHGLDDALVRAANRLATGGLVPDLTLLLTLPGDAAARRRASRGGADRLERLGAESTAGSRRPTLTPRPGRGPPVTPSVARSSACRRMRRWNR